MDIQPLLNLQEVESRLRALDREKKEMPKRKSEALRRLDNARKRVEQSEAILEAMRKSLSSFGDEARRARERAEKIRKDQQFLSSEKAFRLSASEHERAEAAAAKADAARASEHSKLAPEENALASAREVCAQEEIIVQEILDGLIARAKAVEAERVNVMTEYENARKAVNEADLKKFDRLKLTRWPAIVPFNMATGVCSGCNLVQPPSIAQKVGRNTEIVTCQSCGRILY